MSWNTPEMVEIKMDAEIGSYQSDDREPEGPHFVSEAASDAVESA